jgi:anhydro-N-acetylmuramic acid kinase
MVYRAIGLMSGSSLDGLDIAFVEFQEQGGKWSYAILEADCYPYPEYWIEKLETAINLSARDYQLLHAEYGHYTGRELNKFIEKHQLDFKGAVIGSHGHTTFHMPDKRMTAQLGDGAAIAAETQLPVVTDLRALDVALGGQGAPIVPIGEKLLMGEYDYFLNIGGIANLSLNAEKYIAFDVCSANRVLNMLVNETGIAYDDGGQIAAGGTLNDDLLEKLNQLAYYKQAAPKSLANDFGTDIVYPLIKEYGLEIKDALRTYTEHIAMQIKMAISRSLLPVSASRLLTTGGGAFNKF